MGIAPAPRPQLYPTPRVSNGLSDAYNDILGGEPLQSNMCGNNTALNAGGISAVLTVQAGGSTGKEVVIPQSWFGGNVTWVRGLYNPSATPRYQAFMADFTGTDTANYADTTQAAVNLYSGGVLSTMMPVLASVAVGTQLQAYYSYRDGTFSVKGQSLEGWPQLHVDPYQGTANDGDDYLMVSLYHAYLTSGNEKYRKLADRIGNALLDAGRWDSNHIRFDIPFSALDGEVGYYDYWAPTTPFAVVNSPSGLQIETTVNSGGPPWNYAGFGLWPTIDIPAGAVFSSLDVTLIGDGSGRSVLVNLNTDPAKTTNGDYYRRITMIPTDAHGAVTVSLAQSDFWKVGNVVYDSLHQDYSYIGTYGSNVASLNQAVDAPNRRIRTQFQYDFTGNGYGYAGCYFGAAAQSSAGTSHLNFDFYAAQPGIGSLTAVDATGTNYTVWFTWPAGKTSFSIPWIGSIPMPQCVAYVPVQPCYWGGVEEAGLYWGPGQVGFSQSAFIHPVQEFKFNAVGSGTVFSIIQNNWYAVLQAYAACTANAIAFDNMRYDAVATMAGTNPTLLNGVQISFPSNSLNQPYQVTFKEIDFQITLQDGPASDPVRYQGIPRWTYKWTDSLGYIGYGSWRGPSAVGYNWLAGWYWSGVNNPDNGRPVSSMMLDFMLDAQNQYAAWWPSKLKGPFVPRYGRPSWEALTTQGYVAGTMQPSTYNQWYYPDTDDWYGYMYRALLAVAQFYYYSRSSTAKAILDNWMAWLDQNIVASGSYWAPPSDFYPDGTVGYTYQPVYSFTCIAAACIYKYWVDGDVIAFKWYRRMLDSMFATQRQTATGTLAGIYPTAEGSGYTTASVVFTVNNGATAPVAMAFIAGGKITHYDVVNPGAGITSISCEVTGDGSGATGNPYLSDDLVGAFSTSHAGWEAAEILNTYGMLVNGARAGGTVSFPLSPTAEDIIAFEGLLAFYQRTSRNTRPSMQTADWIPIHEYRVDPYHNGSAIENPMVKDTHAKGAMWTETIAPTLYASVEYARYANDWSWTEAIYALLIEFTGNIEDKIMEIFPALPGLSWNVQKTPQFNTISHRAVSGYEVRTALMQYPLWTFSLAYDLLRDDATSELKTLMGFFLQSQGSFAAFLYSDPSDNAVTKQGFGTGDGVTTSFQLIRAYGGFIEPVQNLDGTPGIEVNGVQQTLGIGNQCQISPTGLVTFTTAPASGAALTWTGNFYYRVRFSADKADFNQFMYQLYELKQLSFVGSPLNKV